MASGYAFGYCRFSIDAKGLAENVEDQEAWFREYAARTRPGVPVRVYRDNDKSAVTTCTGRTTRR